MNDVSAHDIIGSRRDGLGRSQSIHAIQLIAGVASHLEVGAGAVVVDADKAGDGEAAHAADGAATLVAEQAIAHEGELEQRVDGLAVAAFAGSGDGS